MKPSHDDHFYYLHPVSKSRGKSKDKSKNKDKNKEKMKEKTKSKSKSKDKVPLPFKNVQSNSLSTSEKSQKMQLKNN